MLNKLKIFFKLETALNELLEQALTHEASSVSLYVDIFSESKPIERSLVAGARIQRTVK